MNALQLFDELDMLLKAGVKDALMIWGAPGIGKSQLVNQVAAKNEYRVVDQRISQLAPTDLRGVPVPSNGVTCWNPPEFLPRSESEKVVLFLDEFNMAPTVMMGVTQQLILDRRIGSYKVPDSVFIWAAGNRKSDRAVVNDMPAPLANRFNHYSLDHDIDAWKIWAFGAGISPSIIGFLGFRSELLHKMPSVDEPAWPSPRSWERANRLLAIGTSVAPAVGDATAVELEAWIKALGALPDLDAIAEGKNVKHVFPDEPSLRHAIITEFQHRAMGSSDKLINIFRWLMKASSNSPEYISAFVLDILRTIGRLDQNKMREYTQKLTKIPEAKDFLKEYIALTTGAQE